MVFGTFDIIHPAHLRFLLEAKLAPQCPTCDLVVIVARNSSIQRIKGRNPIFSEEQRLQFIRCLRLVDYARLGNEGENYFQVILEIQPDYIVLGHDQITNTQPLLDFIAKKGLSIRVCRLPMYESGDLSSSSEVREKVLEIWYEEKKNTSRSE